MTNKFVLSIMFIFFSTVACKEIYYPNLDINNSGLVVEGLITDEPGPYTIKLSKPTPFNRQVTEPETGARVSVRDDFGNSYIFNETSPGSYTSDPTDFISSYSRSYKLIIQTRENKIYESTPETLFSKGSLDNLNPVIKYSTLKTFYGTSAQFTNVRGVEFIATLNLNNDPSPFYRFSNTLLVEYLSNTTYYNGSSASDYCWIKYTPYEFLNLSDRQNYTTSTEQILGFCPMDTMYYGIVYVPLYSGGAGAIVAYGYIKRHIQLYAITFKQYHLNNDIYKYYKTVNTQLAARQQILDPQNVQCTGNITCINDPEEQVMGIFEVSSINTYTYYYYREIGGNTVDLQMMIPLDIESLPESGCNGGSVPYFWM